MRMSRRGKITIAVFLLCMTTLLTCCLWPDKGIGADNKSEGNDNLSPETGYEAVINKKQYSFNDLQDKHIIYAVSNGIKPINDIQQFQNNKATFKEDKKLVKIYGCKYYAIGRLTHSEPYLVPKAKQLLDEIGERFYKKLEFNNMSHYRFSVNSLLRTLEHQKKLSRRNVNATENSAHMYGTTFDISYSKFLDENDEYVHDGKLKRLLIESIGELREEGRCLSKAERKQACYHITVIK